MLPLPVSSIGSVVQQWLCCGRSVRQHQTRQHYFQLATQISLQPQELDYLQSLKLPHWNAVTWSFSFPWLQWPESYWSSYLASLSPSLSLLGATSWSQLSAKLVRSQNLLQGLYCSFAYGGPLACFSSLTQRYPSSRFILNKFPQLIYSEMAGMSFTSF